MTNTSPATDINEITMSNPQDGNLVTYTVTRGAPHAWKSESNGVVRELSLDDAREEIRTLSVLGWTHRTA